MTDSLSEKRTLKDHLRMFSNLFFPEPCLLCAGGLPLATRSPAPLCDGCRAGLVPISGRRCGKCGLALISEDELCTRCRNQNYYFDKNLSVFEYRGDIRELFYFFKFKGLRRIGMWFARSVAGLPVWETKPSCIIPVPSRPESIRKRGFGHVELMAAILADYTGVALLPCLVRGKGRPQKSLDFQERMVNLSGLISFKKGHADLAGRDIILFDDIFTTGATASECARVLKTHRAGSVTVLTVAMD